MRMLGKCDGDKTTVYKRLVDQSFYVLTIVAADGVLIHVLRTGVDTYAVENDGKIAPLVDRDAFVSVLKQHMPQFAASWGKPDLSGTDCRKTDN